VRVYRPDGGFHLSKPSSWLIKMKLASSFAARFRATSQLARASSTVPSHPRKSAFFREDEPLSLVAEPDATRIQLPTFRFFRTTDGSEFSSIRPPEKKSTATRLVEQQRTQSRRCMAPTRGDS